MDNERQPHDLDDSNGYNQSGGCGKGAEDNAMMSDRVVRSHKGLVGGGGGRGSRRVLSTTFIT
jgi:hypothetical protein